MSLSKRGGEAAAAAPTTSKSQPTMSLVHHQAPEQSPVRTGVCHTRMLCPAANRLLGPMPKGRS